MANPNSILYCVECNPPVAFNAVKDLKEHYALKHDADIEEWGCAFLKCRKRFLNKSSMLRHIATVHKDEVQTAHPASSFCAPSSSQDHCFVYEPNEYYHDDGGGDDDDGTVSVTHSTGVAPLSPTPPVDIEEEVKKAAIQLLVDLRSTASLTGKAIERFEKGCNTLLQQFSVAAKAKLSESLKEKGLSDEDINDVLRHLDVEDPFIGLRTIEDQLNYFSEKFGLVLPEEKFLDTRIDKRLDSSTNSYVQCQVTESFMFISMIETLKAIEANKKYRDLIMKASGSTDGVIRSHMDGSKYKEHPFICKHKTVINILLFFDELEVANSLGSKTIIHKLAAFFYQILNLPPELSSELSSIFLLALAYADDLKKKGAMDKILIPLVQELKKLASEEGVPLGEYDGVPFVLRAIVVAVTADTLAAHDLLGLLGPGARHFCRWCMVTRNEVRANANATGARRTPALHEYHLTRVNENQKYSRECGVKQECRLDKEPYFSCVENNVFDCFHDLLEGIVPLVIKLVLHHYVVEKKLFSVVDFNARVDSFSYGIPDSKNKPSPNFTEAIITSTKDKIKQTGSQMWCLIRSLPFLLRDFVLEVDEHLQLIFLLQDIMQIIFSFEIRESDITSLEDLIYCHNELFFKLFISGQENFEMLEVEDSEAVDGDLEPQDTEHVPSQARKQRKVFVTNKLHHLTHYPEMVKKFGNPVRMWCAKFEGRLKIFRQHSSVCCNFKNIPKTMARMFQLSNLKPLINTNDEVYIEHQRGQTITVSESQYSQILCSVTDEHQVIFTNSASLHGEEYRPGLFVALPSSNRLPLFGIIIEVVVASKEIIVVTRPWRNLGLSERFHAYEMTPETNEQARQVVATNVRSLANFRCIAPWTAGGNEVFLSPRTVLV